jgi:hypothetical protein
MVSAGWHRPGGVPCDAEGTEIVGQAARRVQQRFRLVAVLVEFDADTCRSLSSLMHSASVLALHGQPMHVVIC